uniref:PIN domain-containing protein n=1 Tax=Candidatus Kentrum sp. DK TaxID=2126562 RepID=A0A450TL88_9GAMM|nr:MAG: hypothetical protein BECKDK2373C_GA0170839_11862 [Candidatus Kentron sp. DK]
MIYLLDTNTLIYLIKNKPPSVAQRVNALAKDVALGKREGVRSRNDAHHVLPVATDEKPSMKTMRGGPDGKGVFSFYKRFFLYDRKKRRLFGAQRKRAPENTQGLWPM